MNRWEVQFSEHAQSVIVVAPAAADAIIIAASTVRRFLAKYHATPSISDADMRVPWGIRWLGPADSRDAPATAAPEPDAAPDEQPAPAGPLYPCRICGTLAPMAELEKTHRHEDDPRSTYYVHGDEVEGPGGQRDRREKP